MKKTILLSFFFFLFLTYQLFPQAGQWNYIRKTPSVDMNCISFLLDGLNGWGAGYTGSSGQIVSALFKTTNGETTGI